MADTRRVARLRAAVGSFALALATLGVFNAPPVNAADGSLQFCPYLPYLAYGNTQISQDPYNWTLYQVDEAGNNVVRQQGRDTGCHVVQPLASGAYRVGVQGDCYRPQAYRLKGVSAIVLVPDDPSQVLTRVDGQWKDC